MVNPDRLEIKNPNDVVARATDEVLAFMFGVEDALDRTILRYVYKSGNKFKTVSKQQIINYVVNQNAYCTSGRLHMRLESLVKFGFLLKEEYKGVILFTANLEDIKKKSEDSF
jgi:hypothetical protein